MNKAQAEGLIEAHLINAWGAVYPTNKLGLGNRFNADLEQERGTMFMLIDILFPSSRQSAMAGANSPHRTSGIVEFSIFTPAGKGTRESTKVSDFLEETFGLKIVSGIVFKTVQEVSRSNQTVVDLFRKSCAVNFTFDSFTP